jgi:hypothetical protein
MNSEDDENLGALLGALVDDRAPPARVRSRLLSAIEGSSRYLPFSQVLSRHFDLSLEEVGGLLRRASEAPNWIVGVEPVRRYLDFRPGACAVAPRAGLVWLAAGGRIPAHRHLDPERMVVLEGVVSDDAGRCARAGELLEIPVGASHVVQVDPAGDALVALLHGKIHLLGT